MWIVRLINRYPGGCCGQTTHYEVLAEWKYEQYEDAFSFYIKYAYMYHGNEREGESLLKPEWDDDLQ